MPLLTRLIISLIIILLSGCAHQKLTPEQVSCKVMCAKRLESCCAVCKHNCKNCSISASQSAVKNYREFKHQQCVQGDMISRNLQSYRDPLQCLKTTCECDADYKVCIQSCTGLIHKRLQVSPTCC